MLGAFSYILNSQYSLLPKYSLFTIGTDTTNCFNSTVETINFNNSFDKYECVPDYDLLFEQVSSDCNSITKTYLNNLYNINTDNTCDSCSQNCLNNCYSSLSELTPNGNQINSCSYNFGNKNWTMLLSSFTRLNAYSN